MKVAVLILATLAAAVLLVLLVGALLPRAHEASRAALFRRRPGELYAAIRDFSAMPTWRTSLERVDVLPPREGCTCFREISTHQSLSYVVLEDKPPGRLVTKIADEGLPFGGTWTYEIVAEPDGSRLRITERGEVRNVFFRFMARFVFGYTGTMDAYLRDLGGKFGESVAPGP
ncbi:MAG TPA: SRPBCC family protein [Opitutaceae bacterium]|nr:SRPBCC family protein [Opitutaceae bacterium]